MTDTASDPTGAKGEIERVELNRAERTVARRAAEIRATIPHLELSCRAELHHDAGGSELDGPGVALVRACAQALREVPRANGSYRGDWIELHSRVNVGVVVATEETYVIPTIFDADRKAAAEIAAELSDLRRRAADGALRAPELAGATFTLVDHHGDGVEAGAPLVIAPQAAALAAGDPREEMRRGPHGPRVARTAVLTLACDHRILYGACAARFLSAIRRALEDPQP